MSRYPETTRIARVLRIIGLVSTQPRAWTRARLAGHFEVSERMITDDIQLIREGLGFDLRADRGVGYYFSSVPRLPSVSYTLSEAVALILAAQSARRLRGIPRPDLAAAIARLRTVIPPQLQPILQEFEEDDELAPADDFQQETLEKIVQSVSERRRLRIVYAAASRDGIETTRNVDPYSIIPYDRSWHVIGYCHLREDIRIFKVDRIQHLEEMAETFVPDPGFDLVAYLNEGWGLMRGVDGPAEDVVLRFWPPAARWVAEDTWHTSQRLAWREDGSLIFRLHIQITPEFCRWVFRYGRYVDVIEPAHLREWVADEARTILERAERPVTPR